MADFIYQKKPFFVEKSIAQIKKSDSKVSFLGTVIESDPEINLVLVDDGTSKVRVLMSLDNFKKIAIGYIIRVLGAVAPALVGDDFEVKAEIVQDFSDLDTLLFRDFLNSKFH